MASERLLIIGNGGREHALGWSLQIPGRKLYFASGNAGTSQIGENIDIGAEEIDKLTGWAYDHKIDFTVVGPEVPLVLGVVDSFHEVGLNIFGPSQEAARLEGSKKFAARINDSKNIPQPRWRFFENPAEALKFVQNPPWEIVIKADGLAAGKGVVLPKSVKEAEETVIDFMVNLKHGEAGKEIVIQEKLEGQEVSVLAFSDGEHVLPMVSAVDHKRLLDNDKGPNTGGMGVIAPAPFMTPELLADIQHQILKPVVLAMKEEGYSFIGVLYAGLMLTDSGSKVLEYNVRFGDPETQAILPLLESNLDDIMQACIEGRLDQIVVKWKKGSAASVVLASCGYPEKPEKGQVIHGLDKVYNPDINIFHAGTAIKDGKVVTSGGRVLGITARSSSLSTALSKAYSVIGKERINFSGMQYRKDIGLKFTM